MEALPQRRSNSAAREHHNERPHRAPREYPTAQRPCCGAAGILIFRDPRHLPRVVGSRIAPCFRLPGRVLLRLQLCALGHSGIRLSNLTFDTRDRSPRQDQREFIHAVPPVVIDRTAAIGVRDSREECPRHEQQGPEHREFAHGRPLCSRKAARTIPAIGRPIPYWHFLRRTSGIPR
jgi:hypothetical protein